MGARPWSAAARALSALGVAFLLSLPPSVACAANTATFTSAAPKPASFSMATTPKVTVTVYDKYGMRGSGAYSMTIDGHRVSATCTYIVTGSFNPSKPDYRRFRLTYQVPASLSVGTHTVVVKVRDLRKKTSTYTWKFSIDDTSVPATFGSLLPTDTSSSQVDRPKLSVTVAERWDVKGARSYSMKLDGAAVPCSIAYTASGSYKNFKVSYQVPAALTPGTHSVTVSVTDAAARTTSYTWSFTVIQPDPVYEEMPIAGSSCTDCHAGYPAAHPMMNCPACHSATAPPRPVGSANPGAPMRAFPLGGDSAHTLNCRISGCHVKGATTFPHVLDGDCTRCHNSAYPSIPPVHAVNAGSIKALHVSTSASCTVKFCHTSSLTAEHYRHSVGGARLSCRTCHESTDTAVAAAISGGVTSCESCHPLETTDHASAAASHRAVGGCVRTGCHATDVTVVHKRVCAACHAAGVTPSVDCGTCHPTGTYHAGMDAAHRLSPNGCVASGCHGVGLGMNAALTHKNDCSDCHAASGKPVLECTTCHTASLVALHSSADASHTAPVAFCTASNCHGTNVATTHFKDGAARCGACHGGGKTPSTACATCHSADILTVHTGAAAAHAVISADCIKSGCHSQTDAALLHVRAGVSRCEACHAAGKSPSLDCASCHTGGLATIHSRAGSAHTSTNTSCVKAKCHAADTTVDHAHCTACHGRTTPLSSDCPVCHTQALVTIHSSADTSHTPSADYCRTVCHDTSNVATIHEEGPNAPSCAACHRADREPSVRCADCHTGTIAGLHAWANASHVSYYTGGCLLAGCHNADVVAIHKGLPGQGCPVCHGAGATASTTCSACHFGDITTLHKDADAKHAVPADLNDARCISGSCHPGNASAIHVTGSVSHCTACHDGVKTPSVVCSDCHTGTVETLHRDADSAHVSSTSGCVSSSCHSSDVSVSHTPGQSCPVCHGSTRGPNTDCQATGCHPGDVSQLARHVSLAGASHEAPAGACVQAHCHGDGSGVDVAQLHMQGTGAPGCAACHATGKTASIVCSDCHSASLAVVHTKGSAYHTAPVSSCYNSGLGGCHSRDVIALHVVDGGPGCYACHEPGETPSARCADCHAGAFWGVIHPVGTKHTPIGADATGCVTSACHNTDVATIHSSNAPTNGPGCSPCHAQGVPTLRCTQCHTIDMTPRHSAQNALHSAPAGVCVNSHCHGSDTGANVASLHWQAPAGCLTCHANGRTPSATCATCHPADPLTFHTGIGTKHHAAGGTCIADGCHGTTAGGADVVALHSAGTNAPGCSACHGPGITPSVACGSSGCHNPDPFTEHQAFIVVGSVNKHLAPDISGCSGTGCHLSRSVTSLHGTNNCTPCHGQGKTPSLTCAQAGCHDTGITAIHAAGGAPHRIVDGNCVSTQCHNKTVEVLHGKSTGPKCAACHAPNAGDAATADCATCHIHTDGTSGRLPTKDSTPTPHPTLSAADSTHTVASNGCTRPTCHATNIAAIHLTATSDHPTPPGCMACHGAGKIPSRNCGDCHVADFAPPHPAPAADHMAGASSCTQPSCHGNVVSAIHVSADGVSHCDACHGIGVTPTLDCSVSTCHGTGFPPTHPAPVGEHTTTDACTATCHRSGGVANVAVLHAGSTSSCLACHGSNKTPSLVCAGCHGPGTYHLDAPNKHAVANSCVSATCHQSDVTAIHGRTGCVACHGDGVTPSTTCADCHPGVTIATHMALHTDCNICHAKMITWHTRNPSAPQIMAQFTASSDCTYCHGATPGTPSSVRIGRYTHTDIGNIYATSCVLNCHNYQTYRQWTGVYDDIAPTTIADVYEGQSFFGTTVIRFTATDTGEYSPGGSGVGHTYFKLDGAPSVEGTSVVVAPPASGRAMHTVSFYSKDLMGNTESSTTVSFSVSAP